MPAATRVRKSSNTKPMNIFLVGYMYSGKTTLGKHLAHRLGYSFADTDQMVEERCHTTIATLFQKYGEKAFRQIEQQVLQSTQTLTDTIIATGGGLPCFQDNMGWINRHGLSVYIHMDEDAICARAAASKKSRPLLANLTPEERRVFIAKQLSERKVYYEQASLTVEGFDSDIENITSAIITHLNERLPETSPSNH